MKAARMLKTQAGFSLIELMIVVAIIGILASVAVPNFKRFQVKARQSEAKASLTAIFTAEKAFQGEWTAYTGDFRDIGYAPNGKMRYNVGFGTVGYVPLGTTGFVASTEGAGAGLLFNNIPFCAIAANNCSREITVAFAASAAGGACLAGADPTQTAFVATAQATKESLGSTVDDYWTINEGKLMCNNTPGI